MKDLAPYLRQRLKRLAKQRQTTVSRLFDEMATLMFAEYDAETRCLARAERGQGRVDRGLELLEKAKQGK